MARLVLFLFLFAVLALVCAAAATLVRALSARSATSRRDPLSAKPITTEVSVPRSVRNVSYVVLLLLLLGAAGGWIGLA